MANVIKTVLTYPLDGSTRDFNIPFEYLARKFVVVTLIGKDRKVLTINADYRFATRTTISLTKAWGPADSYETIEVRRVTSTTDRLVDFTDGSILRAYDLNVAQIQTMHVAEEARDLTSDTIGVNNDGHLDARGRRVVNVADGIDPGDAVTVGQMNRWSGSAADSANKAKTSENNAKTSETNSKASEQLAKKWAENPKGTPVVSSQYSAKHWALTSEESANASAISAGNSQAQVANAKAQADRAGDYANDAMGYRDAAKTSAQQAAVSENNAATSASSAKTEADKLMAYNDLLDRINSVAVSAVGSIEIHTSRSKPLVGTVPGDGQLLSRAAYPDLWKLVENGTLPSVDEADWITNPAWRGNYTRGNGVDNFRVPDYNGVQSGSIKAPVFRGDGGGTDLHTNEVYDFGVPNVKGKISRSSYQVTGVADGPFLHDQGRASNNSGSYDSSLTSGFSFDMSRVHRAYRDDIDEVRMNSIAIVWVIRAFGVVHNPGAVDGATLATRIEQVYVELKNRLDNIEANAVAGHRYTRQVYASVGGFTTSKPAVCSEDMRGKLVELQAFAGGTTGELYSCAIVRIPDYVSGENGAPVHRVYAHLGDWKWMLRLTAVDTLQMVGTTSGTQPISYINVIADNQQPQT